MQKHFRLLSTCCTIAFFHASRLSKTHRDAKEHIVFYWKVHAANRLIAARNLQEQHASIRLASRQEQGKQPPGFITAANRLLIEAPPKCFNESQQASTTGTYGHQAPKTKTCSDAAKSQQACAAKRLEQPTGLNIKANRLQQPTGY